MYCSKCGRPNSDDANFCSFCGERILKIFEDAHNIETTETASNDCYSFKMQIKDIFSITARGIVLTGKIETGSISAGQKVTVLDDDGKEYVVEGIEKNRVIVQKAEVDGDCQIGLLLPEFPNAKSYINKWLVIQNKQKNTTSAPNFASCISSVSNFNPPESEQQPQSQQSQFQQSQFQQPQSQQSQFQQPQSQQSQFQQSQFQQPQSQQPQFQQPQFQQKISVSYRTGKGMTVFSIVPGNFMVSDSGVQFVGVLLHNHDHSYGFDQIIDTRFEMTHTGIQPMWGYKIRLKTGEEHIYTYSPISKNRMTSIDAFINSNIKR